MRLSKRQKKVWRQKLVEKKITQKQCRPVYLSMNKVCIHFCLLYLHLKENGKMSLTGFQFYNGLLFQSSTLFNWFVSLALG